ncbi:MAG: DUF1631 family protein [Comamonadaceae bacterium]|nr:MAG: DUF1631 family protein [Comamonadaceae bacterium]
MAAQPEFLQHCLQEAAGASRLALEHCIDDAVAGLQVAETQSMKVAERDEIAAAWRFLANHKTAWSLRYPSELLEAFREQAALTAAAVRSGTALAPPRHAPSAPAPLSPTPAFSNSRAVPLSSGTGPANFSLVDDSDVTKAIESSRLLQQILPAVDQPLAELDGLISAVQGLTSVRPEFNPLRPEIFTNTLRSVLASAPAEPELQTLCVRHIGASLGRELKRVYERVVNVLEMAHVQAASYRVLQTPASASPRMVNAGGKPGAAGATGSSGTGTGTGAAGHRANGSSSEAEPVHYADLSDYEIRDDLFQDFLFRGGSHAHQRLAPSYYEQVERELADLTAAPESASAPLESRAADQARAAREQQRQALHALPAVDRPSQTIDVSSQLNAQVWGTYARPRERAVVRTQLKKEAVEVGQVLGLEVVRKLVNQVAHDPRLLLPVREAIVALEPSLLRLAMVDPRFFSDESHPGRRLMERVAQRSFKYNDEFSPEFDSFFQPLRRAFNELNVLEIGDAQPFGVALATLEYGWDEHDQHEVETRRKVLHALDFAEERQAQADQIAFDLSSRADLDNVPGVVLDFLFGPWSLAMAHAKLLDTRNQVDPQGFGSVVPDLLWSVKTEVTLKRPAKLIEMIPGLLEKLHSGLGMLGQSTQENQSFFDSLMKLHQPVLRLRRLKTQRDAEESGAMPLEAHEMPATPEQRLAKAAEQPWLGREDLDVAGFEDTQPTEPGDLDVHDGFTGDGFDGGASDFAELDGGTRQGGEDETLKLGSSSDAARAIRDAARAAASRPQAGLETRTADLAPLPGIEGVALDNAPAFSKDEAGKILLALRTGSWVDLYSKHRWLRAQLVWASSKATLFMFLSHGGQPHSMTKRSCEKLIMQRLLRPVDTHGVVAHALDAVASEVAAATPLQPQPESVY